MKICIFSDIHGNNYAFSHFVKEVANKYDYYLFAGDIYGYYYGIDEVITLLKKLTPIRMVIGNHDANFLNAKEYTEWKKYIKKYGESYRIKSNALTNLLLDKKDYLEFQIDGVSIAMVHGTIDNHLGGRDYPDKIYNYSNDYLKFDLVVQGHTHCKMIKQYCNTIILNPGSIGQSRNKDGVTYAVYDTNSKKIDFKKIIWDKKKLYQKIMLIEPKNIKLIEVLEREEK